MAPLVEHTAAGIVERQTQTKADSRLDLDSDEGTELLRTLCRHATSDEFVVTHKWRTGDIAFWDNRATQHRVDNDFGDARRRGERVTINGDTPR